MGVGERLKIAMKSRKVTQVGLAKLVGVSQTSISQALSGKITKPKFLEKIAIALQIDLDWLENGSGSMEVSVGDNNKVSNSQVGGINNSNANSYFFANQNQGSDLQDQETIKRLEKQLDRIEQQQRRIEQQLNFLIQAIFKEKI